MRVLDQYLVSIVLGSAVLFYAFGDDLIRWIDEGSKQTEQQLIADGRHWASDCTLQEENIVRGGLRAWTLAGNQKKNRSE